ncbi:MAG TPA: aldo/keto reductase, partial [Candidatus Binataceae bacterium]|nr:aldo/keto reductase [Candidatus Binataceae bacterium]
MKTRRMGRTGLKVSEICLGTMTFGLQCDEAASFKIMDEAASQGIDFFDTADGYPMGGTLETVGRTETIVGNWLKGRRHDFVLATKCWVAMSRRPNDRGLSRKHIFDAVEASLRRLQTDYIDLYQAHAPDPDTPLDETMRAFDDLVRQGKVRYIGCSNFKAWLLATAMSISDRNGLARFDCVQPRYNMLFREIENELLPLCEYQGVGVIAYNPLAGGFLTGKYQASAQPPSETRFGFLSGRAYSIYHKRYWHDAQFEAVDHLKRFFVERGKSLTQAAIAWVLARPEITSAIVGA